ncbi:hypothetical protein [Streptomyces sp. SAJ15]|uniref:hypothetical protein n=1 Tax=Streptomyces sp. SAJ15 TaxID=2011095 RepID=UPI0011869F76|nr:hypothetical protein [Streptomyces sp. SAJ15]TVL90919.1 hypothetical protein CD790_20390 [Streptomyces sp. SAJ15]
MAERDGREADARDDDAAFAEIVAAYGEEPEDPPGAQPWPEAENLPAEASDAEPNTAEKSDKFVKGDRASDAPAGSFVVFAPGVGPRDWEPGEPSEDDFDASDEGHFVPPEPPPLPHADTTARFAWLAVLGGPLLLLLVVLLGIEMTWWLTTLGVGGFLGGFATLVMRMKDGDEDEDDDPGRGAVV